MENPDHAAKQKHLYRCRNSPYWYVRYAANGRRIRRSTKVINVTDAIAIRDRWLASAASIDMSTEWSKWVAEQIAVPTSWTRLTHSRMRRRTRKKAFDTCMTIGQLGELLARCGGKCEISGVDLKRPQTDKRVKDPMNVSIDRIDSALGYTLANCRVVCLALNIAMNQWGEGVFRALARRVVAQELVRAENVSGYKSSSKPGGGETTVSD